jgi:hypothetical protein
MDHYGNASMEAKRKAYRPVIQRLLKRRAAQPVSIQQKKEPVRQVPLLDGLYGDTTLTIGCNYMSPLVTGGGDLWVMSTTINRI